MQRHNEVVAEYSDRMLKEFQEKDFTEAELIKSAEAAIGRNRGNKAMKAAAGGAHLIKVSTQTIFDMACTGAGTLDCHNYDPNYRWQKN